MILRHFIEFDPLVKFVQVAKKHQDTILFFVNICTTKAVEQYVIEQLFLEAAQKIQQCVSVLYKDVLHLK